MLNKQFWVLRVLSRLPIASWLYVTQFLLHYMPCTGQLGGPVRKAFERVQSTSFSPNDESPMITDQHTAGGSVSQLGQWPTHILINPFHKIHYYIIWTLKWMTVDIATCRKPLEASIAYWLIIPDGRCCCGMYISVKEMPTRLGNKHIGELALLVRELFQRSNHSKVIMMLSWCKYGGTLFFLPCLCTVRHKYTVNHTTLGG